MPDAPQPTVLYDGKHIQLVRRDKWEYATRKNLTGIVAIVAVTDDGKLVLVEQYRPPVGARVIELPAGLAGDVAGEESEELSAAARRELLEETGYEAEGMTEVGAGAASAGLSDEIITLFLATGLRKTGTGEGDGSEEITVHKVPVADVPGFLGKKVQEGCHADLKVYAGLFFASSRARAQ
jgi:ADP-ribose pyrophosphatase